MCHMLGVRCHVSGVTCQVSGMRCHVSGASFFVVYVKGVELVSAMSVINRAFPV